MRQNKDDHVTPESAEKEAAAGACAVLLGDLAGYTGNDQRRDGLAAELVGHAEDDGVANGGVSA